MRARARVTLPYIQKKRDHEGYRFEIYRSEYYKFCNYCISYCYHFMASTIPIGYTNQSPIWRFIGQYRVTPLNYGAIYHHDYDDNKMAQNRIHVAPYIFLFNPQIHNFCHII